MMYIDIGYLPKLEFACTEAMNTLATNLSYCGDNIRTIMLTSRYAFEGKSFVAINLLRTMASLQKKVVLIDTDLRCSKMVSANKMRFSETQNYGLAHYLAGMCEIEDIIYETNVSGACIVPVGRKVSSSLQLLSSKRMGALMEKLSEEFDVVLVDTPPVGIIVDALEVAKYCDGALLVVGYNRGHKRDITEAVNALETTGCRVLGAALNNVDFSALTSRKYYYRSERYSSYYKNAYNPYHGERKQGIFERLFGNKKNSTHSKGKHE